MKRPFFCIPIGILAAALTRAQPVPQWPDAATNRVVVTPELIGRLAETMRTNAPALRAGRARAAAAEAAVGAVRTWEDPMVKLGLLGAGTEMRADEGDLIYGVEQKLPLFGKPQAARRLAQAESAVEQAAADYVFQTQRRDLARALFRAALADRGLEIGGEDLAWLETITAAAEQRYPFGEATQAQVLRLQNERSLRANQLATDRQRRGQEWAGLNRLLNREVTAPWPALELPPLAGPIVYSERLAQYALTYEPRLNQLRRQMRQAEAAVDATRRARLPDLSLGAENRSYSGTGGFRQAMVTLSLNVPWGNAGRYRAGVRRDEARRNAATQDAADYELGLRTEVFRLTLGLEAARREALLYEREVIPRAAQALASAQTVWTANRGLFLEVLEARRMLLDARLNQARAVAEQYDLLADLVLCCGLGDLEALRMIGALPDKSESDKQP